MAALPDEPILMGEIVGLFGVRGWVKVFSHSRPRAAILGYDPWLIEVDGHWQPLHVLDGKANPKGIHAQIEGYHDRDQAQGLMGLKIFISPQQLPPLKPGEYYWAQLLGLRVVNKEGVELGLVDHLIETGANDVLVLKQADHTRMLPYIPDVVKQVDLEHGSIQVDWDPDF